ncbi:1-acylglycerol-3-phosphate O-acyltransferase [Thorsellia anophelis]|uniref:1-acyl-sn-glycerol-3-phosphate acyltransferase n=1 Tax=Thorsellia anophelis DSM 18579 TaxID=1123402 RepID=A0A1H9Y961_9GAMM|nr:1-acylglycerol-3-phosphate O-acyltransferase [Thorsellia anophelis]SES65479.1 1-acyl-sn-glycerol-3-phosphate acyltransferase [Thorsellia anophelis DSM 18579]
MLFVLRFIITIIFTVVTCTVAILYCLMTPKSLNHVSKIARYFRHLAPYYGIKVIARYQDEQTIPKQSVYIANHQNNFDLVTAASLVRPGTVTVGKKSLKWIPLWGQLYWLSGNILIDRNNRAKSHQTILQIVEHMKRKPISIWMFPEGTRSRGRGLLPFKVGAFHTAIAARVPVIPLCVSNTCRGKIKLNRWNNGYVIVEMLPPIDIEPYVQMSNPKEAARALALHCHSVMKARIEELDAEVAALETSIKL